MLYNVTFGFYMLDWWEVVLCNSVGAVILAYLAHKLLLLLIAMASTSFKAGYSE